MELEGLLLAISFLLRINDSPEGRILCREEELEEEEESISEDLTPLTHDDDEVCKMPLDSLELLKRFSKLL